MSKFLLGRDAAGKVSYLLPRDCDYMFSALLVSSVEQTITVPDTDSKWEVIFSFQPGAEVWVAINNTAAFPTGAIGFVKSRQNPVGIYDLKAGDVIHFFTPDATARIGGLFYAIQ